MQREPALPPLFQNLSSFIELTKMPGFLVGTTYCLNYRKFGNNKYFLAIPLLEN